MVLVVVGGRELIPLGTRLKVNKKLSLVKMSFFEAKEIYSKILLSLLRCRGGGGGV